MSSENNISFSRNERLFLIILLSLIFIGLLIWGFLPKFSNYDNRFKDDGITQKWKEFQQDNITENSLESENYNEQNFAFKSDDELKKIAYQPQAFDPNSSSIEKMIAAGVPINSAKRIIKYRNKGGKFYDKEKLMNFGFSPDDYQKVAPYISINIKREYSNNYSNNYSSNNYRRYDNYNKDGNNYTPYQEPTNIPINTAGIEELKKIRGIGDGYAKRIIERRDKLGGFINADQIDEIYGLPDSMKVKLKEILLIEPDKIQKININSATLQDLKNHPYTQYLAQNIIQLRQGIGSFKKVSDLRQVPLINEEKYRKIVPYINID